MPLNAESIKKMYTGMVTNHYDLPISHFFKQYKENALNESSLKQGDKVIVFCCGTGLDFSHIQKKIGETGKIVGVDFSADMLKAAQKRIKKKGWKNIGLLEADVTKTGDSRGNDFDGGVCTLGMSIIPEYIKAYENLLGAVKSGGEVIIGDAQYASGWKSFFNPIIILMGKRYGATKEGHKNSIELCRRMEEDLIDVKKKTYFLDTYFYSIGKKK